MEIILKGTLREPIMNFYFHKMLSIFKIFVHKVVQKLLFRWYGTAQFKLDIYMSVTRDFLDKFLVLLMSYTWENQNTHLHTCHSRVVQQIYQITRKLHAIWTSLSCNSRVAHEHWTNLLSHLQMRVHYLVYSWSVLLMRNICTAYDVMCKMNAWLQHLWIRLQITHRTVYSHCSLLHQPVIFQYRSDCCLIPSASAY